ncbi:MAG: hypothetical protein EBS55_08375, partial [Flavobacteriaceae bacterium]|nr:hypothetical protein [Flavobacteriaceae bacterium]
SMSGVNYVYGITFSCCTGAAGTTNLTVCSVAGSVYFKGRAMMVKNSLYLMAMECEVQKYDEMNHISVEQSI